MPHLISWNLFGLESADLDLRSEAAAFTVLLGGPPDKVLSGALPPADPPELVLFQEVVDRSLAAHLRPHLSQAGYNLVTSSHQTRSYYEVLAVRSPWTILDHGVHPLDSALHRELLWAHVSDGQQDWLVLTAHLESMKHGSTQRMAQAQEVLARLRAWPGPAVFGGDTNLREAEAAQLAPLPDAWEASGSPTAHKWTSCGSQNRGRTKRYDRIWGHNVRFSGFETFGRSLVASTKEPPSDHLGVRVHLRPA